MSHEPAESTPTLRGKPLDGHRLTEFIYGTVTAMVAVSGLLHDDQIDWGTSMAIIIVGAVAVWLAHAYAGSMSRRVLTRRLLTGSEVLTDMRNSWPIVTAGILVSLPLLLVPLRLFAHETALNVSNAVGMVILTLVGVAAGIISESGWLRTLILAALSAGLGLVVLSVELLVH